MDATNQKLLRHVILQVNNHPISKIFSRPLNPESTLDLSVVSNRVAQNFYRSINDFVNDIEHICSDARFQPEKTQYYIASASFLKKLVYKQIQIYKETRNVHGWCSKVYEIREKLKKIADSPPVMPNELFTTGIDPSRLIEQQLPTETTLKKLVELSSRTLTQSDLSVIPKIINYYQPSISVKDNMPIDVRKLSTPTINALMEFMEKKLNSKVQPNANNISVFNGI